MNDTKAKDKKADKENSIYEAAYELFITKGFNKTAIDDIVKKAGVAKGTFYLYFKDKYDIINRIIIKKSYSVLKEAVLYTEDKHMENFIDKIVCCTDYIIEFFKENKLLLKLINKNISWGMFRRALVEKNQHKEMQELITFLIERMKVENIDSEDPEKTLFIIFELVGSVCYSSIVLEEPDDIDKMKPILFKSIKKILTK